MSARKARKARNLAHSIKREASLKFLYVIFDENIFWDSHKELTENKVSKDLGILYETNHTLSKDRLTTCVLLLYTST